MLPKSKMEIYDTTNTLRYTINNGAEAIHTKETLNDIGTFGFTLPVKLFKPKYGYNDIETGWKAKIYFNGYTTPTAADLVTTGIIQNITGPMDLGNGYTRIFEGVNQGEVLQRRQKTNKNYIAIQADDIVAEIASDLGLSTDLDVDTSLENQTVRTMTYFDLLKQVSDYWVSAGVQVKKDFYVNPAGALVWKTRPLRTTGVTPLTVVKKENCTIIRDKRSVKNNITVYGAARQPYPSDKDTFTEATSGTYDGASWSWSAGVGDTVTTDAVTKKYGNYSILGNSGSGVGNDGTLYLELPYVLTIRDINTLSFWEICENYPTQTGLIRILAPDLSNYFEYQFTIVDGSWHFEELSLGPTNEYDATLSPNGKWTKTGTPNWWNMAQLMFYFHSTSHADFNYHIDSLFFSPTRYSYTISDATSISAYGQADAEFTDDNLTTNQQCEVRARTLLYQLKDQIIRADVLTRGDINIKIGDRIPFTYPIENISAVDFDVISVEHNYTLDGFKTKPSMINSGNTRFLPALTPNDAFHHQIGNLKQVTSDLYSRIVR
jgi:hypothetical protein